jgi:hypothetical protein
VLEYDSTTQRWRLFGQQTSSSGSSGVSNPLFLFQNEFGL